MYKQLKVSLILAQNILMRLPCQKKPFKGILNGI